MYFYMRHVRTRDFMVKDIQQIQKFDVHGTELSLQVQVVSGPPREAKRPRLAPWLDFEM